MQHERIDRAVVLRGDDEVPLLLLHRVGDGDDRVAVTHGEAAAGDEIILQVHQDQSLLQFVLRRYGMNSGATDLTNSLSDASRRALTWLSVQAMCEKSPLATNRGNASPGNEVNGLGGTARDSNNDKEIQGKLVYQPFKPLSVGTRCVSGSSKTMCEPDLAIK